MADDITIDLRSMHTLLLLLGFVSSMTEAAPTPAAQDADSSSSSDLLPRRDAMGDVIVASVFLLILVGTCCIMYRENQQNRPDSPSAPLRIGDNQGTRTQEPDVTVVSVDASSILHP